MSQPIKRKGLLGIKASNNKMPSNLPNNLNKEEKKRMILAKREYKKKNILKK